MGKKEEQKKSKKKRAFIHQKEIFWVKKMTKAVVWFFATTVYIAHRMGWVINVQNHDDIIYCNPVGVLHSEYMQSKIVHQCHTTYLEAYCWHQENFSQIFLCIPSIQCKMIFLEDDRQPKQTSVPVLSTPSTSSPFPTSPSPIIGSMHTIYYDYLPSVERLDLHIQPCCLIFLPLFYVINLSRFMNNKVTRDGQTWCKIISYYSNIQYQASLLLTISEKIGLNVSISLTPLVPKCTDPCFSFDSIFFTAPVGPMDTYIL